MGNYSPIRKIYVRNFRNIENAEIDFTQSPIVSLVGDNEAGKTSIVKAISVCAMHDSPKSQKGFIRTGTDKFGIGIELEDNTLITRLKAESGLNKYSIKYPDGREYSIDKLADGLPKEVADVMGLMKEPETGEYLQIRTYENLLLFALTPSSTNYKMVYEALKIEQIVKAIKQGSTEANALKNAINSNMSGIEALQESMTSLRVFDISALLKAKNNVESLKPKFIKSKALVSMLDNIDNIDKDMKIAKEFNESGIEAINESVADKLIRISSFVNSYSELSKTSSMYEECSNLEQIDADMISKLVTLVNMENRHREQCRQHDKLVGLQGADSINDSEIRMLQRLVEIKKQSDSVKETNQHAELDDLQEIDNGFISRMSKISSLESLSAGILEKTSEINDIASEIESIKNLLVANNVMTGTCDKCGETVIVQALG